jgi:hypothetical protein
MGSAKVRKALAWSLVACSLPLAALGYVRHQRQADARVASQGPGPEPGRTLMALAIQAAIRRHAAGPGAVDGPELGEPAVDQLDGVACWRFPFLYWADTGSGRISLHRGCVWVKDGHVLRARWD